MEHPNHDQAGGRAHTRPSAQTNELQVEIRVKGRIDADWSDWFGGLRILHGEVDETLLVGTLVDQAWIYGILAALQALNLPLISVNVQESGARASAQAIDASGTKEE